MMRLSPSHFLLLFVAAIWGSGFVAQVRGMDHLGPHSFNMARFALAALSLVPLWWFTRKKSTSSTKTLVLGGLITGTFLFAGFTMQQLGLQHTTAGNAGFITSMYIVLVPIIALVLGQKTRLLTWLGIGLAVIGLYVLSVKDDLSIGLGDGLVLIGAIFWAGHVLLMDHFSDKVEAVGFSIVQFVIAAVLASIMVLLFETPSLQDFQLSWFPLLYAGIISSGVAFTLQLIGQRGVSASVAALILSLEAVFAVIAGVVFLQESVGTKELIGCSFMLAGIMMSQWPVPATRKPENVK